MNRSKLVDTDLTVELLTQQSEVAAISAEWDWLLESSPCNQVFSSVQWFLAACCANPAVTPHVIVARRDTTLAGIAPLVLTSDKRAEFPTDLSDYNDFICRKDDAATLLALLQYALSHANGYDRLVLRMIRRDSNCVRAAKLLHPAREIGRSISSKAIVCPYITLSPSYEDYLATRTRGFIKALKRALGKARRNNLVTEELQPKNFPPGSLAEVFLSLHLKRQGASSCFNRIEDQNFVRLILPEMFQARRMRVFAVSEKERILAVSLNTASGKSLGGWNWGFLPEAGCWSPGKLLLDAQIRQACELGLTEYDLMRGDEAYKKSWATRNRTIGQLDFPVDKLR